MTKPIPDGFHTLTPHIVVTDGAAAIEFYQKAFGAQELVRHLTPGSETVMHAQLKIGNAILMLGSEMDNPEDWREGEAQRSQESNKFVEKGAEVYAKA